MYVVMAFMFGMTVNASFARRFAPITLPAPYNSEFLHLYKRYRLMICTLALAFLQFVQAFGVIESGTFRFLPVMLPPPPDGPARSCCMVGDVVGSDPVFPVEALPADDWGGSRSMVPKFSRYFGHSTTNR